MTAEYVGEIDTALRTWRQGDIVLTDGLPAIHLANLSTPGTLASELYAAERAAVGETLDLAVVSQDFAGFMIISQTCDIVRSCKTREFVELSPLVDVPEDKLGHIRAGRMPRYLACSGLGDRSLAADLERVTTIEKRTLIQFNEERITGAGTDDERRRIASALARKRARPALPNDFVSFVEPLQRRVKDRHGRHSDEGRFLAATREIRVAAEPNWIADQIEVSLLFLFDRIDEIPAGADAQMTMLLSLMAGHQRYALTGRILALEQLTAAAYLASDALDLDALSDA